MSNYTYQVQPTTFDASAFVEKVGNAVKPKDGIEFKFHFICSNENFDAMITFFSLKSNCMFAEIFYDDNIFSNILKSNTWIKQTTKHKGFSVKKIKKTPSDDDTLLVYSHTKPALNTYNISEFDFMVQFYIVRTEYEHKLCKHIKLFKDIATFPNGTEYMHYSLSGVTSKEEFAKYSHAGVVAKTKYARSTIIEYLYNHETSLFKELKQNQLIPNTDVEYLENKEVAVAKQEKEMLQENVAKEPLPKFIDENDEFIYLDSCSIFEFKKAHKKQLFKLPK